MRRILLAALVFTFLGSGAAPAALVVAGTFNPSGAGSLCGLGFDPVTGGVWVYACSAITVQRYTPTGALVQCHALGALLLGVSLIALRDARA